MSFLKLDSKPLILLLVVIAGIIITSPYTNFQDYLSQGDHGRDLYAAEAVYRGELPYKDFWWVYGPLTPYYYGLFYKIFGVHITSILLGKLILRIAGGMLLCLGLMEIVSPWAAFLGGCWLMLFFQDFFFTYNHLAGVVMILGVAWCLLSYINRKDLKSLWKALGFIFILCLIKINFGLAALTVALITVKVTDTVLHAPASREKKIFYALGLIGIPVITFLIYYSMLHGLTTMEIRQCLPYKEGDQPYSVSMTYAITFFLKMTWHTMKSTWINITLAIIINASALYCIYLLIKNKITDERKKLFLLSLGMLCLFFLANFHEYLKSGVWYRSFWSQPLGMMVIFLIIDTAVKYLPHVIRKIVFTFMAGMAIYCWLFFLHAINSFKIDSQFIALPRAGIYTSNAPAWIQTVEETTAFLNKTLKPDELFFALPYDCLYYYLTGKRTPTRQIIFFEHILIPPEQEKSVIADLERNHVNYVLVSNRAFVRQEVGLGYLGSTYCPLIGKYINDNFAPIARFGDWTDEPGWAWNHGTMILKRKGT